jgi:phage gp36-like protein
MYLSVDELGTHLYSDNIDVITRGDSTIAQAAIDAAISETKGYLSAFDKDAIFSAQAENRNALLLTFVKDIAAWHLLNLCSAGSDLKLRQDRYDRAVGWLKEVQKGNVSPDLPLLKNDDGTSENPGITWGSNAKREQHF